MPALHDAKELEKLPLFRGLGQEDLEWLNEQMNRREMASKKHLLLASQPGDTVYIIQNGTVKIHVEQSDGTDVTLAILGIGDIVGEMSLMDQAGRSANAVTLERSIILSMHVCSLLAPIFSTLRFTSAARRAISLMASSSISSSTPSVPIKALFCTIMFDTGSVKMR